MATSIDPAGNEPKALFDAVTFAGARVLEIGSGDGRLALRYAGVARSVIGLESSADDVATAGATCRPSAASALCATALRPAQGRPERRRGTASLADSPSRGFGESAEALAEAEAKRRRARDRLRFVRGSGVKLPFGAATFDIALFGWSL